MFELKTPDRDHRPAAPARNRWLMPFTTDLARFASISLSDVVMRYIINLIYVMTVLHHDICFERRVRSCSHGGICREIHSILIRSRSAPSTGSSAGWCATGPPLKFVLRRSI